MKLIDAEEYDKVLRHAECTLETMLSATGDDATSVLLDAVRIFRRDLARQPEIKVGSDENG